MVFILKEKRGEGRADAADDGERVGGGRGVLGKRVGEQAYVQRSSEPRLLDFMGYQALQPLGAKNDSIRYPIASATTVATAVTVQLPIFSSCPLLFDPQYIGHNRTDIRS